eukprot:Pgem_evm1s3275
MNKWNCEAIKRVNRKEFREFMADINSKSKCDLYKRVYSTKIDNKFYINPDLIVINGISRLKFKLLSNTHGERGSHRGSLVSRNGNCCNIDVSNNDSNNNDNGDDDDVEDDDDDDDDNNDDDNLT